MSAEIKIKTLKAHAGVLSLHALSLLHLRSEMLHPKLESRGITVSLKPACYDCGLKNDSVSGYADRDGHRVGKAGSIRISMLAIAISTTV